MNVRGLIEQIKIKQSVLCVGLDTDIDKLPKGVERSLKGMLEFNRQIIEATRPFAVSYKINTAFYEAFGSEGWKLLEETRSLLPADTLNIADAKRGDIGNTSGRYAKAFFDHLDFDAITVAPYMGKDSIQPFLDYQNKVTIVLGLTSNEGSADFQTNKNYQPPLYETVIKTISGWADPDQLMFVTGATKADELLAIRKYLPAHFLLVPGVGAQGGSAEDVCRNGMNHSGGLLINSSRGIIYASGEEDFALKAAQEAEALAKLMKPFVEKRMT